MLPIYSPSPSGKSLVVNGKVKKLVWYTKVFYLSLVMMGAAFIVSTMVVNEHSFKKAIVERLSWSSSQKGGESGSYLTKSHCDRCGAEALPKEIVVETSDLQLRSLVEDYNKGEAPLTRNLLAMAVGIKQKKIVNDVVKKFPLNNFTIMLFHYDGVVDQWHVLSWSNQSIHIGGFHQTKWWFAKRFMHPDIVAQYNYVFLWDEDLGVEHFRADKGVRREKVGVIDAEYILHMGIPSLGGPGYKGGLSTTARKLYRNSERSKMRKRASSEMKMFMKRWKVAAEEDAAWTDPYPPRNDSSANYHKEM